MPRKSEILEIPNPSKSEVKRWLRIWEEEKYNIPEKSLNKLFSVYPLNQNLEEVLIKVYVLNSAYSTNIFSPLTVAKHIVKLNIDKFLSKGDPTIVNRLADVKMNNNRIRSFYSFTTKYCSFHQPTEYPIYDSYIVKTLSYFKQRDNFSDFTKEDLRQFKRFKIVILDFKKNYHLESFDLRTLDKYLWLVGKENF